MDVVTIMFPIIPADAVTIMFPIIPVDAVTITFLIIFADLEESQETILAGTEASVLLQSEVPAVVKRKMIKK